ncbi:hypothetical protein ACVILL_005903 [Bradyrhizobium sp. USDA 3364]
MHVGDEEHRKRHRFGQLVPAVRRYADQCHAVRAGQFQNHLHQRVDAAESEEDRARAAGEGRRADRTIDRHLSQEPAASTPAAVGSEEPAAQGAHHHRRRDARSHRDGDDQFTRPLQRADADLGARDREGAARDPDRAAIADARQHADQHHDVRHRFQHHLHQPDQSQDARHREAPASGTAGPDPRQLVRHLPQEPRASTPHRRRSEEPAACGQDQARPGNARPAGLRADRQARRLHRRNAELVGGHRQCEAGRRFREGREGPCRDAGVGLDTNAGHPRDR